MCPASSITASSAATAASRERFCLPEPIDVESVTADLKDGLLTITIPKAGGRGARRVDVA